MTPPFVLSTQLSGHDNAVRSLCTVKLPPGIGGTQGCEGVLSGSYDRTAVIWVPDSTCTSNVPSYSNRMTFSDQGNYVQSVTYIAPSLNLPDGGIATGGLDTAIYVYSLATPEKGPMLTLLGHTGAVVTLTSLRDGRLISGSWDHTTIVWKHGQQQITLKGHEGNVNSILVINDDVIATASSDATIKLWRLEMSTATCTMTLSGHSGPVRHLDLVAGIGFISSSNDLSLRLWSLDGHCIQQFYGHTEFVYGVIALHNGCFASCSEDRCLKIWSADGECIQTITHPKPIWSITALSNGDIASAGGDGVIRMWSCSPDRAAGEAECEIYRNLVSSQEIHTKTEQLGGLDPSTIKDEAVLLQPGARDGETVVVKRGAVVEAHRWNAVASAWDKIGDVVGAPESEKKILNGKEYDYVFDVALGDANASLKLGHNDDDNPFSSAQRFLEMNELSQDYLSEIAEFITKNVKNTSPVSAIRGGDDPFTGNGAYVPSSIRSSVPVQSTSQTNNPDPFTGNVSATKFTEKDRAFPNTIYVTFDQGNLDAIMKKIRSINEAHSNTSFALSSNEIKLLDGVAATLKESSGRFANVSLSPAQYTVLNRCLDWPREERFPVLDLLRLAILHGPCARHYGATANCEQILSNIIMSLQPFDSDALPAHMLALRFVVNSFYNREARSIVLAAPANLLESVAGAIASSNRNIRLAITTLVLNISAALCMGETTVGGHAAANIALQIIISLHESDPEILFRCLVALGTLATVDPSLLSLIKENVTFQSRLNELRFCETGKLRKCVIELSSLCMLG